MPGDGECESSDHRQQPRPQRSRSGAQDESGKAGFSLPCAGWRANGNLGSLTAVLSSVGLFCMGSKPGFFLVKEAREAVDVL